MAEIRKLLKLTKTTFAVTIPSKYLRTLELTFGDLVEIMLETPEAITIKKHKWSHKN